MLRRDSSRHSANTHEGADTLGLIQILKAATAAASKATVAADPTAKAAARECQKLR